MPRPVARSSRLVSGLRRDDRFYLAMIAWAMFGLSYIGLTKQRRVRKIRAIINR